MLYQHFRVAPPKMIQLQAALTADIVPPTLTALFMNLERHSMFAVILVSCEMLHYPTAATCTEDLLTAACKLAAASARYLLLNHTHLYTAIFFRESLCSRNSSYRPVVMLIRVTFCRNLVNDASCCQNVSLPCRTGNLDKEQCFSLIAH